MVGFMYTLISIVIGSYQEFAFENSMNRRLYTQDKESFKRVYYSAARYEQELEEVILNRKPLEFTYWEYISSSCLSLCCCCGVKSRPWYKTRMKRVEMHE